MEVLLYWVGLAAVAVSALTGVLTRHGGQRSRAGGRLLGQVLGFRQFLRRVTPSHLLMRLQRDPQYFYRTLPYAEAMGLGAMFARKFGDTELDLIKSISYAAHMCYKFAEQKTLKG